MALLAFTLCGFLSHILQSHQIMWPAGYGWSSGSWLQDQIIGCLCPPSWAWPPSLAAEKPATMSPGCLGCPLQDPEGVRLPLTLLEPGNGFSLSSFCPHQVFWDSFQKASSFHGNRASRFQVAWGWTQGIHGPQAAIGLWSRWFTWRCCLSRRNTKGEPHPH